MPRRSSGFGVLWMRSTRRRRASNFGSKPSLLWFVSIGVCLVESLTKGADFPPAVFCQVTMVVTWNSQPGKGR